MRDLPKMSTSKPVKDADSTKVVNLLRKTRENLSKNEEKAKTSSKDENLNNSQKKSYRKNDGDIFVQYSNNTTNSEQSTDDDFEEDDQPVTLTENSDSFNSSSNEEPIEYTDKKTSRPQEDEGLFCVISYDFAQLAQTITSNIVKNFIEIILHEERRLPANLFPTNQVKLAKDVYFISTRSLVFTSFWL